MSELWNEIVLIWGALLNNQLTVLSMSVYIFAFIIVIIVFIKALIINNQIDEKRIENRRKKARLKSKLNKISKKERRS